MMNKFVLGTTFLSNIPTEIVWIIGFIFMIYLAIKLITKLVMRVVMVTIITILTYLIKAGILSQFFQ